MSDKRRSSYAVAARKSKQAKKDGSQTGNSSRTTGNNSVAESDAERLPKASLAFAYHDLLEHDDDRSFYFQKLLVELSVTVDMEFTWSVSFLRKLEQQITPSHLVLASFSLSRGSEHGTESLKRSEIVDRLQRSCATVGDKAWMEVRFPCTFHQTASGVSVIDSNPTVTDWNDLNDAGHMMEKLSVSPAPPSTSSVVDGNPAVGSSVDGAKPSNTQMRAWTSRLALARDVFVKPIAPPDDRDFRDRAHKRARLKSAVYPEIASLLSRRDHAEAVLLTAGLLKTVTLLGVDADVESSSGSWDYDFYNWRSFPTHLYTTDEALATKIKAAYPGVIIDDRRARSSSEMSD